MNQAVTRVLMLLVVVVASRSDVLADTVVVQTKDGRQLTASIHERTDDARLWLQYGSPAVTVIRPIAWDQIAWVTHDGERIGVEDLKSLAATLEPAQPATPRSARVIRVPSAADSAGATSMADRARKALGATRQVTSVRFDAAAVNWDGDVETDGLQLRVVLLAGHRLATEVSGTLQVEFVARRHRGARDEPRRGASSLGRIGRWTRHLDEADFENGVATVRLPFQAEHPEFDTDWLTDGIVHVRFVAPGHGRFEHSLEGVRVRPFAPLRDALQAETGRRFLATESTSRGERVAD